MKLCPLWMAYLGIIRFSCSKRWRAYCVLDAYGNLLQPGDSFQLGKCRRHISTSLANNLDNLLHKNVECYIEDLVVKSRKSSDHLPDLRRVFDLLRRYRVTSGKFLGFIVRHQGIEIHQAKVDAIWKFPSLGISMSWRTSNGNWHILGDYLKFSKEVPAL